MSKSRIVVFTLSLLCIFWFLAGAAVLFTHAKVEVTHPGLRSFLWWGVSVSTIAFGFIIILVALRSKANFLLKLLALVSTLGIWFVGIVAMAGIRKEVLSHRYQDLRVIAVRTPALHPCITLDRCA